MTPILIPYVFNPNPLANPFTFELAPPLVTGMRFIYPFILTLSPNQNSRRQRTKKNMNVVVDKKGKRRREAARALLWGVIITLSLSRKG